MNFPYIGQKHFSYHQEVFNLAKFVDKVKFWDDIFSHLMSWPIHGSSNGSVIALALVQWFSEILTVERKNV